MGIFVKKNNGTEYLYMLTGKSHYFLGKKDSKPGGMNPRNLHRALDALDENFDRLFLAHLQEVSAVTKYLPAEEKARYVSTKKKQIHSLLEKHNAQDWPDMTFEILETH